MLKNRDQNCSIKLEAPKEILESLKLDYLFPDQPVFAQVATQSKEGPHIRTMRLYDLNGAGQLIFLSRTDTLKWKELWENSRTSICLLNPHSTQIIAEGDAHLVTVKTHIEIAMHYWNNLPWEIKQIYSDQEDLDKTPLCFGIIVVLPTLWEIMKLRKHYSFSERVRFYSETYDWRKEKIDITS